MLVPTDQQLREFLTREAMQLLSDGARRDYVRECMKHPESKKAAAERWRDALEAEAEALYDAKPGEAIEVMDPKLHCPVPKPSPLQEFDAAVARVTQDRGKVYGHPADDFARAAHLKSAVAACPDPRVRHALEMILVKIARLTTTPDHLDSWIDIAGYARTAVMIIDRDKKGLDVG